MITGNDIRKAREARGLSLRDLSKKIGVPHTTIFRAEEGHIDDMKWIYVMLMADGLGLTLPQIDPQNRVETDLLEAFRNGDYALVLRITAAHIENLQDYLSTEDLSK